MCASVVLIVPFIFATRFTNGDLRMFGFIAQPEILQVRPGSSAAKSFFSFGSIMERTVKEHILVKYPDFEKWDAALSQIDDSNIGEITADTLQEYGIDDVGVRDKVYNVIREIIMEDMGGAIESKDVQSLPEPQSNSALATDNATELPGDTAATMEVADDIADDLEQEPDWKEEDDTLKLSDNEEDTVEVHGHYGNVTDAAGGAVGLLMDGPEPEWNDEDDTLKLSDNEEDDIVAQEHYGNITDAAGGAVGLLMDGPEPEWKDQDDALKLSDDEQEEEAVATMDAADDIEDDIVPQGDTTMADDDDIKYPDGDPTVDSTDSSVVPKPQRTPSRLTRSKTLSVVADSSEIDEMRAQFRMLHKQRLMARSDKQYDLTSPAVDDREKKEVTFDIPSGPTDTQSAPPFSSGQPRIFKAQTVPMFQSDDDDEELAVSDMDAMKMEYLRQKRQSLLLQSQKQYSLVTEVASPPVTSPKEVKSVESVDEEKNGDNGNSGDMVDDGDMLDSGNMVGDGDEDKVNKTAVEENELLQRQDEMAVLEGKLENKRRIRA